ncbi:MAG: hypothetical protein HeimC2_07260 [Candidatus Heimdallarchaeota archaeon LC_2]|nr:MAG: hypothetical protein HeimC2_07260 [Candidatus Heimdallarchaeota archaeon LC_2]
MKKEIIFLLLLIFSVSLLIPLYEQKQNVNLLPSQKKSIVYNLHNPILHITADKTTDILISISMISESGEERKEIIYEGILDNKLEINKLNPGLYGITFTSTDIVRIEIVGKGLYLSSIIIIGILFLINIILIYLKYYN